MARKVVGIILTSIGFLHIFITILVIRAFIPILPYFSETEYIKTEGAIIDILEPDNITPLSDIVDEAKRDDSNEFLVILDEKLARKNGFIYVEYYANVENVKHKKVVRTKYKPGYELGDIVTVYYEDIDENSAYVPEISGNDPTSLSRNARIALVGGLSMSPRIIMVIVGIIQLAIYFRRKKKEL